MQDYKQALQYGLLAVETAEKQKVTSSELSTIYNRVGLIYYQLLQYEESNRNFRRSMDIALNNRDTFSARIISPNVINSYLRLSRP